MSQAQAMIDSLRAVTAVAIAEIDLSGLLVDANAGFLRLLPAGGRPAPGIAVVPNLISPSFARLIELSGSGAETLYEGLMTLGDPTGKSRSLRGSVSRTERGLFLLLEYDVEELSHVAVQGQNLLLQSLLQRGPGTIAGARAAHDRGLPARKRISDHQRGRPSHRRAHGCVEGRDRFRDLGRANDPGLADHPRAPRLPGSARILLNHHARHVRAPADGSGPSPPLRRAGGRERRAGPRRAAERWVPGQHEPRAEDPLNAIPFNGSCQKESLLSA